MLTTAWATQRRRIGQTYRAARGLRASGARSLARLRGRVDYWTCPDDQAVALAFSMVLRRDGTPHEIEWHTERLQRRVLDRHQLIDELVANDEFAVSRIFGSADLGPSLHFSRGIFIRSLPAGRRVLDLGGAHRARDVGALVAMGYPHPFDELVVVDLPSEERHELYKTDHDARSVDSHLGPISYRYHSMADLSAYDDASFDLVYAGQSIEHVTAAEADDMLRSIHRVLAPNGAFALDTPNGRVCRLQQREFIDPDHKVEYTHEELGAKLRDAGFDVVAAYGLNDASRSLAAGTFAPGEVSRAWGLFADPSASYLLAYLCRPRQPSSGSRSLSRTR